jgi:3-deoxy-D-manno-octulosonic-acid transferase
MASRLEAISQSEKSDQERKAAKRYCLLNVVFCLFSPYILLSKLIAALRGRPKYAFDLQRIGGGEYRCDDAPKDAVRVVFLGASFGETEMMDRLQSALMDRGVAIDPVWTIRNRVELERVRKLRPNQPILLWPFDFYWCIDKWIKKCNPDLLVVIEKFWFPGPILHAKACGSRVAVVNGRTNNRHNIFRKMVTFHYPWILEATDWVGMRAAEFTKILARTSSRMRSLVTTGNVKAGMPLPKIEKEKEKALREWFQTSCDPDRVFVVGSTEFLVEDSFVLDAFLEIREQHRCCIMIAPRKSHRAQEIRELCESKGLKCSLRTAPQKGSDVLILDTLGELASTYGLGIGSFIGGTILGAGHNIIEPLQAGVPVAYGPVRDHFEDLQILCETEGVGFRVHKPSELATHWLSLIEEPGLREKLAEQAKTVLSDGAKAFDYTVDSLELIIAQIQSEKNAAYSLPGGSSSFGF